MKNHKIEIGHHSGGAYWLELVLCRNAEVLFGGAEDPTGNGFADEACEAVVAAQTAIERELGGLANTDGHYPNWNGGRYGAQCRANGYEFMGHLVARVWAAGLDEGGLPEGDAEVVPYADSPASVRDLAFKVGTLVEKAIAEVVNNALTAKAG